MTRYTRVLELAEQILAAVSPKGKSRSEVERFVKGLRASKELPEHCEWAERAEEEWNVTGKALELFKQLEDIVNFRPKLVRAGVYDEENEEDDFEEQVFVTELPSSTLYVQWQLDLNHEQEFYSHITPDFGWRLEKNGDTIDQDTWDSTIDSSWSDSSHSFSRGDAEPGEWKPGKYIVHLSMWEEPLASVEFMIVEGAPAKEDKDKDTHAVVEGARNRYERVADLAKVLEAQLAPKAKSREEIVAFLGEIRRMCAERSLPKSCEWVEQTDDRWEVSAKVRKRFEAMEDLVNFHPKLLRIGFFDGKEEAKFERPLVKRFDRDTIHEVVLQIEIDHEDEQYDTIPIEWRWKWTNPDGTVNEGVMDSHVENTWGNSFHNETFMPEVDGEKWETGRHTITVSLWDEPFAEATLMIDAKENEASAL